MTNSNPPAVKRPRILISLMSGTSVDTIDAAVCRVESAASGRLSCEMLSFHEHPITDRLRERIFRAFDDGPGGVSLVCSLNVEIGQAFAHAALGAVRAWGGDPATIDAIASHGQTLFHIAPHMTEPGGPFEQWQPSTLQVGEPAVISALTGLPVISNFRVADMAVGGNGAPLVPFADYHLFGEAGRGTVVHNLGGIGNCTWLPPSDDADDVIAFDTGPANMIIDGLVSHFYAGKSYDDDGRYAAAGEVQANLLKEWMEMPYITAPPPKSTGRELFGRQFVERIILENRDRSGDDLIATATEFTAHSLVENLRRYVAPRGKIDRLVLAGGGARNSHLVRRITALWNSCSSGDECSGTGPGAETEVLTLDELGLSVNSKSRECAGFALLGYAHLEGMTGNLPGVTGAKCGVVLGQFTPAVAKA